MNERRHAPATERNREPIREVLARFVPKGARVLEIAAGTGQHAAYLAPRLEASAWLPTDGDPTSLASIDAWRTESDAILPARVLDVTKAEWPEGPFDVVYSANMIHIAPWACCEGLVDGAARVLGEGGLLVLYGPFKRGGAHTAPSNEAFDASLRARDPRWGVRDLEEVTARAAQAGLSLREIVEMPANNLTVIFSAPTGAGRSR